MLKICICDDENIALDYIRNAVESILMKNSIPYEIICASQKLDEIRQYFGRANVYVLDIDFHDKTIDGIDFAGDLREVDERAYIIFISGHDIYLVKGFSVQPFDFLMKPIDESRLEITLNSLYRKYLAEYKEPSGKYITIISGITAYHMQTSDIIMISSEHGKITVYTVNQNIQTYETLEHIEKKCEIDSNIVRCHKSYIVNRKYIDSVDKRKHKLYLSNNLTCDFSTKHKFDL